VVHLFEEITEAFSYEGGWLIWKNPKSNAVKVGDVAGTPSDTGYITIVLGGVSYKAHRLIWIYHHGSIDDNLQIDHINGIRHDNRIENLRLVTNQQNALNRHAVLSIAGLKGVTYDPRTGRYRSRIKVDGKQVSLGTYDTAE